MYRVGVIIGRFQPIHNYHIEHLFKYALSKNLDRLIVCIGSVNEPRTIKNPFTFSERKLLIEEALIEFKLGTSTDFYFEKIEDNYFSDAEWADDVKAAVRISAGPKSKIILFGATKDDSSFYLNLFPEWELDLNNAPIIQFGATDIRQAWFDGSLTNSNLPNIVYDYLNSWQRNYLYKEYKALSKEFRIIRDYKKSWNLAPYPPIFHTADTVIFHREQVALIKRKASPGKGLFALPGGFIKEYETLFDAALRETEEETGVSPEELKNYYIGRRVFDHPGRSLRGRTITTAHCFVIPNKLQLTPGDDAAEAIWVNLCNVERSMMFEDHFHIIQYFRHLRNTRGVK